MAIELDVCNEESISLEQHLDYLETNLDFASQESILNSAQELKKLSKKKSFLGDFLIQDLRKGAAFQEHNSYSPGYRALAFESDPKVLAHACPSQKVPIKNRRYLQLSKGKMLYFRTNQDVHTKPPPDSLSVSINLLPQRGVNSRIDLRNLLSHRSGQDLQV